MIVTTPKPRRRGVAAGAALALLGLLAAGPALAQEGIAIPAPARDAPVRPARTEVAVVAGGCFWGVQGVFQHVEGVKSAVSGYAGGEASTAKYRTVGSGRTGRRPGRHP